MLLKPLYNITYFYLISLSPDWPHRSILTIPYVACSQTHIPRPTIQPPKTHQTATQYCATRSTLQHYVLLPHLSISRLTISVNIDHTICSMQSDAYSPTDLLTAENPSNHHSERCYSSHSTTLRTSTSSLYLPTDHIGQHWPYHMQHAVRLIFSDRPVNHRKPIKPALSTMLLKPLYIITHFYLISLSPDWPHRSILTIPYVACSQTHIPRPTF